MTWTKTSITLIQILFFSLAAIAEQYELFRKDGSKLTYRMSLEATSGSFPLVVLITGSECKSNVERYEWAKKHLLNLNVGLLSLEKPGIHGPLGEAQCPEEYIEKNDFDRRVEDHLLLVDHFRAQFEDWNSKIIWIGGSEGAMVSGVVSPKVPETSATVLLVGGGGVSFEEEMLISIPRLMKKQGVPSQHIPDVLEEFKNMTEQARKTPVSTQFWGGDTNTYRWWASVLDIRVVEHLLPVQFPILLVQGDKDVNSAIESADIFASKFLDYGKDNITYLRLEGLDHGLVDENGVSHMDRVFSDDIIPWINRALQKKAFSFE